MKKILALAAGAVLAISAQAGISYQVDVTKIEDGGVIAGTVPTAVTLKLVDKGGEAAQQIVYSASIDFTTIAGIDQKYFVQVGEATRFDVKGYVTDKGSGTFFVDSAMVAFSKSTKDGVNMSFVAPSAINPDVMFPGWTDDQITLYADAGNLKTAFVTGGEEVEIPVAYNLSGGQGASQLGSNVQFSAISPVPEPTSGMMLLLGLAGLALKRKRTVQC